MKEKTAKGYTPGEAGTPYAGTSQQPRAVTGVLPQLCNPLDEAGAGPLLADDRWWLQEKFDGRRVLIRKDGDAVVGINRTGLTTDLPSSVADAVRQLDADRCLLDGEAVGEAYVAFDLLEQATLDLRPCPFYERYDRLLNLVDAVPSDALRYADTATTATAKRATLEHLRRERREGAVFKRSASVYTPGRPASGGDWLKLKFTATASCLVAGANGSRRSVRLELADGGGRRVAVGNVTIPTNHPVPVKGDVVEVRYLHAFPDGGSLYQPVYLGKRDDVTADACTTAQLKFKPADGDDEAAAAA